MGEEKEPDWARDADPLFTFLGLYVATFQWMEGQLDQIILMYEGHEKWSETQSRLAKMDNRTKVDAMAAAAVDVARFSLVGKIHGWPERLVNVASRLHEERRRRNRIMHSQFIMEGMKYGLPAIRSKRGRGATKSFDQEELSRPCMDEILREIGELGLAIGLVAAQLRQAAPH